MESVEMVHFHSDVSAGGGRKLILGVLSRCEK